MAASPCAILVVTATVEGNATRVYEALGAGALDAVETPVFGKDTGFLLVKLDMLGKRIRAGHSAVPFTLDAAPVDPAAAPRKAAGWLAALGASAGGPAALAKVLSELPKDFPGAIVIVQHIDSLFSAGLISWLGGQCKLPITAVAGVVHPEAGHVYVAAEERHVVIDTAGRLAQSDEPSGGIYLPSIDVLFRSMALNWKKPGMGVLLTGMGRDGAAGLKVLRSAGYETVAQDRASSAVYGMPKAAAELGAASVVLSLDSIARRLTQAARDSVKTTCN
jgi:two-component system, chemotaxis family, response regulator WspF